MEGEAVIEEGYGVTESVGGGNILILADSVEHALYASERAVSSAKCINGVILPFPGGVVRRILSTPATFAGVTVISALDG